MIIPHFRPTIFNPSLLANNLLFSWGRDVYGRLGINSSNSEYFADYPVKVDAKTKFKEVSVSPRAGLAIKQDGTLWSWGNNQNFLLGIGLGNSVTRSSPVQIGSDSNWKSIKSADTHALALKEDGSLWTWGLGAAGRLGLISTANRSAPTRIGLLSDWSLISVGTSQSLAIKTDGSLWSWGSGQSGQLGLGDVADRNSPVRIGSDSDWAFVEGGWVCSFAIKANGTLWAWGNGNSGKLGTGSQTDRSSPVQVGLLSDWFFISSWRHSIAIKTDGSLWAWGTAANGELGDGTATNRSSPVPIMSGDSWKYAKAGNIHSLAIRSDGTMWSWGNNAGARLGASILPYIRSPIAVANDQSWNKDKVFSCGTDSFFAINNDDKLVVFGYNGQGSLGLGDVIDRSSPVLVNNDSWSDMSSWDHTLAIKTNGTLWSWGEVSFGKTGNNRFFNFVESSSPIQVGLLSDWSKVNAGENHSLAIKTDGTLWSWGRNNYGQLGTGDQTFARSSPVQVGLLSDWSQSFGGRYHSLAIKTDGTIWSWGRNDRGQLGLGLSTTNSGIRLSPVQIGSLSSWSKISSGNLHCMAIKTDGTLWAWGINDSGQLGLGNTSNRSSPVQVGLLSDWQFVSCGRAITAAIKTDGTLWAWGFNEDGRLGINSLVNRSSPVQVGSLSNWAKVYCGRNLMAITNDNKLYGAGPGSGGSLAIKTIVNTSSPVQVGTSSGWKKVAAYTFNLGIK